MGRQICELSTQNKEEALRALELLMERVKAIPDDQSKEPVYETVVVTNEGTA